ncbi:helix-turn-helix domain-containing protein [Actinacidiphila paucisporea]|uniref:Transcriptional regulator, XRE family with cupin sensor n=1 Tax=Actinacidiphila paucisporea TaxID=310782 RepID=A0A1M7QVV2_9ACTN|nr:XRE family transcriptional regulator [Actinacidiphila paucisporea]SHN36063.1 transcriptional regulator, XRE family with cupin sensor [Actinacidiphila paucisporea]
MSAIPGVRAQQEGQAAAAAGLKVPGPSPAAAAALPGTGAFGPSTSRGSVRDALSVNLNRRRLARGWSLRELSTATGISKGLLSQIERAEANPTLDILSRIAAVLETDPVALLRRPLLEPEIVRVGDLTEPDDETAVNLLFSAHGHSRVEIYRSRLHPHAQSQVSSHGAGSVEYVMVVSGRVSLMVDGVAHRLETGDSARFDGRASHYYTTQDCPATTHSIVGFPMD